MRLRSIEHKIFLLILPLCLVPTLLLMVLLGVGSRLTFEQTIGSELSSRAEYLAVMFDQFLSGRVDRLRALDLAQPLDPQKIAASAAEAGAAGLVVLSPDRPTSPTVVLADPADASGRWIAEAPFFRPFTQGRITVPPEGSFQDIALPVPARVGPLTLLMFVRETPARERVYFLFEAKALVGAFRRSLPQHPEVFFIYSSSGFVPFVFGNSGLEPGALIDNMVNNPSKARRWFTIREETAPYLIAPADSKYLTHARIASGQGPIWSILLTYDMENFLSPLESYIWLSVLVALALVLGTLVIGLVAGRRIVRPLVDLKHQAEAIAQGNLDVRVSIRSNDEIGELADTFNTMSARLAETVHTLEERLEDNLARASHINVINEITNAIVQVPSLDNLFEVLIRELGKLVRFDALWIALREGEAWRELRVMHIHPAGMIALFDRGRIPLAGSIHGHVVESQQTVQAEIGHHDRGDFFETRVFKSEGFQSYLIAPLSARGRVIGTLTVASTAPDALGGRLVSVIDSLAGAVAIAIEQTDMIQRISHFAGELENKVESRSRELERMSKKLIQTEKYFATGRMAGNLAHEINNPLGIIKNYLRLVENDARAAQSEGRAAAIDPGHLQVINEEVDRIARLVGRMLGLHRPEESQVRPVDLNAAIEEILSLMEADLGCQQIRVARELAPGLPALLAAPDLIRQLLINLLRNAQDAMDQGGTLTVRTSLITQWSDGAEQQFLRLRLADTGCGIPTEHLSQIFDPFFTTKPPDKGTGLGLCVSYSIVRMYHGTIDVESQVGAGTAVVVTLPVQTPGD